MTRRQWIKYVALITAGYPAMVAASIAKRLKGGQYNV